ncbi:hypothetical protein [Tenacibaculum discolor]|uniref:hypothetical protein n=1 Tax=Tenacibaculum discolor TaxID=361581 RepID=UPI000EACF20B|nr:hypothetical protein [Tenacibaculum discolor]RLK00278.1 hypothetical protein C8N27_1965 [Tenacibaculum discolor]
MKKIITVIMLSIMIISCKEEEVKEKTQIKEIELSRESGSNMLRFATAEELKAFISQHHESETDLLDEARRMSEEGKYNPLLLVYNLEVDEAEKLGINEKEVPLVSSNDDMLLLLLNEDGEIGIQDKIFRIDGEFVYTYTEGSSSQINEFLSAYKEGKIEIEKGKTIEYTKDLSVYMHNNKLERDDVSAKGATSYVYFNSNYRMKARQYNGYWVFYSSIGAKTKVQKRKKFLWWSNWKTVKTDNRLEYELSYKVYSTFGFPTVTLDASGHKYCYCNSANKVYDWSVGFPIAPNIYVPQEGQTKHWAHWYSTTPNTVSTTLIY